MMWERYYFQTRNVSNIVQNYVFNSFERIVMLSTIWPSIGSSDTSDITNVTDDDCDVDIIAAVSNDRIDENVFSLNGTNIRMLLITDIAQAIWRFSVS